MRSLQDDNRALRDDLEEAKADLEGAGRKWIQPVLIESSPEGQAQERME